jgi:hypothetical protein
MAVSQFRMSGETRGQHQAVLCTARLFGGWLRFGAVIRTDAIVQRLITVANSPLVAFRVRAERTAGVCLLTLTRRWLRIIRRIRVKPGYALDSAASRKLR